MAWSLGLKLAHTFMMKFLGMETHTNVMESFRDLSLGLLAWKTLISKMPQVKQIRGLRSGLCRSKKAKVLLWF